MGAARKKQLSVDGGGNRSLECGDLSPLSPPERLVAQAEPRRAVRRTHRAESSVSLVRRTAERGAAGTTSRPSRKSGDKSPHSKSTTRQPRVTLLNRQRVRKLDVRRLRMITLTLLGELKVAEAELGVTFVADEEMTLVNETFLQHEGSTDVITFDHTSEQDSRRKVSGSERNQLHGELFICVDEAIRQARRFRTTWQSELTRYIVHGVLHLLGHDDHCVADRLKMKREENRLMRKLVESQRKITLTAARRAKPSKGRYR